MWFDCSGRGEEKKKMGRRGVGGCFKILARRVLM